jgi:hypothetical protein
MTRLTAARTGLVMGFGISTPILVWLGASLFGPPAGRIDAQAKLGDAMQVLWVVQTLAIVLAAARGIDADAIGRLLGAVALVVVPLPLLVLAWLAEATTGAAILRGLGLCMACTTLAVALGSVVERTSADGEMRRVGLATVEVALAAAVWAFRDTWLGWVRG